MLPTISSLAGRAPRRVTLLVLLAIAGLIAGAIAAGGGFEDDFTVPGIESQRAQDMLEQRFPAQAGAEATIVVTGDGAESAARDLVHQVEGQPHVVGVETQTSPDGGTVAASVQYDVPFEDLGTAATERLEKAGDGLPGGTQVAYAGELFDGEATGGFPIGEVAGLVVAVILLLVVLRSARAARSALLVAFAGVGFGFAILLWASTITTVPGLAPTLAGMLGIGAGIDYALLLAARHQEELRAGRSPIEAARRANASAGHSAVTAAAIVMVSISGLVVTGIPFVGRTGVAAGVVVLGCALVCILLGPARFIAAGSKMLPRRERRAAARVTAAVVDAAVEAAPAIAPARPVRRPWATRRPWLALAAGSLATAALALPAAGLELGQPDDRNLPAEATQRQAYDRLAAGFGPGVNGPLVVAVADPTDGQLQKLERGLAADPEVADVAAAVKNPAGDAAVITVTPKHGPQDDATRGLVDRLRADVIPETGANALVGGRTARFGDEAERIASRIPLFAAAVVGMSLLLLLAAFRSWRIALLSALFNLASIAAAYGVVVLAFQTATGADLLGVEQLPVVPYVPLFMFAILFGLSTDYNVFLISRVREEWDKHADHRAAIAAASAGTRRIITAAGGIMVAVFLGFATDPDPVIKMTGVGLATAVLVDVTLVRLLMAPAALSLLGNRLWTDRRRRVRRATAQVGEAA